MANKAKRKTSAKADPATAVEDGSVPLKNARQEAFCQLMTGFPPISASAAYVKAGYSAVGADGHASRMVVNGSVANRIRHLKDENDKLQHLRKNEALLILSEIARAKIDDFMDEANQIKVNGRQRSRAVSSVKVRRIYSEGEEIGTETELRMRDPCDAIEKAGKMCGWFAPEKVEHSGGVKIVEIVQHDDGRG